MHGFISFVHNLVLPVFVNNSNVLCDATNYYCVELLQCIANNMRKVSSFLNETTINKYLALFRVVKCQIRAHKTV